MTGDAIRNVMSIDVEDWFCVYNLSQHIRFEDWDKQDSRVEQSTLRLLDMFSRHRVSGTFLCSAGWRTAFRIWCVRLTVEDMRSPPTATRIACSRI